MKQQFACRPVDLGHGYSVEFSFTPHGVVCEWSPDVADYAAAPAVFIQYRRAIQAFIAARLERRLGDVGSGVTTFLRPINETAHG